MRENRVWPALLRLAMGAVWLFEAYPQLQSRDNYLGAGFVRLVQGMAAGNPWHFYQTFLTRVVIPHASVFSYLSLVGNVLVGICLLLGLLTPYAAAVGLLLNVNYALAAGWMDRMDYSLNGLMFVASIIIIGMAAGQTAGVDTMFGGTPAKARKRY